MDDKVQEYTEFLLRVEASAPMDGVKELPLINGWHQEQSTIDPDPGLQVRYATYTKIVKQPISGEGPSVDLLADIMSDVEIQLESGGIQDAGYEKRVYMISHPIAVWHSGSDV